MQVLVLAVQNAIDYSVLGAATSGVTLARGIGGSIGAAVFGTIFSTHLRSELHNAIGGVLGAQVAGGARLTGAQVESLPARARLAYENAYVHALQPVFLVAAGVGAVGFLSSLRLRERPLRATASTSQGIDDALAAPKSPNSLAEIDRALSVLVSRERRQAFNERVGARASVDLSSGAIWALARFGSYECRGHARWRTSRRSRMSASRRSSVSCASAVSSPTPRTGHGSRRRAKRWQIRC